MLAIFFALITFLGWGIGDVFAGVASRRIGSFKASFWILFLSFVLLTPLTPVYIHQLAHASPAIISLNIMLGALVVITELTFLEAMRRGNASIVGTIAGSFVALTVVLSIIFLGDHLGFGQILAILAIVLGLGITSINLNDFKNRTIKFDSSIILAFITMVGWGTYFTFIKIPINHIGWFWPEYIGNFTGMIILLLIGTRHIKLPRGQLRADFKPMLVCALLSGGGMLTYNLALQHGSTAVVAPIAGSYPVLFVITSMIVFKDRVSRLQKAGMAVTLAGIVVISLVSG